MRVGRIRAVALAGLMVLTSSGSASVAAGAVAPAGVTGSCTAAILGGPPSVFDIGGTDLLGGAGSGSCVVTPWPDGWTLLVLVRLQVKVGGAWKTRATARTSISGTKATKRVSYLEAGYACTTTNTRTWRTRVTAMADIGDKASFILATRSVTSAAVSRHC